ncbi:MAG: cytidylate kinase-like family protein [Sphingobacteriia bacterium]|nr:cytidylate kinase-like family protein [Sphingobacteriia bacterium]
MMNHIVISIGRQFGSGGRVVGKRLAETLGIDYYDRDLLFLAAKEHGFAPDIFESADEKTSVRTGFLQWLNGYFFGTVASQNYMSNETLFKMQSDVIRSLAEIKSCVIVGRCSDYILRDNPHHISVFLQAPMADRIERVAQRMGVTNDKAQEIIKTSDKRRSDYYNYYSSKTWGAAATYDMCINVSLLGVDKTVELIAHIVKEKLQMREEK